MIEILKDIYYLLMIVAVSILLLRWKQEDKRLYIYIVVLVLAIATEKIHDLFYSRAIAVWVYHIYFLLELLLLSRYYYTMFQNRRNRLLVVAGSIVFLGYFLYLYAYLFGVNFFTYNRSELMISGILITVYSVLYLIELYQQDNPVILKSYPHFWVVFGNLLFFAGDAFFNGYTMVLVKLMPHQMYFQLSYIPIVLNYLLYLFYIIGFLCPSKQKISESLY